VSSVLGATLEELGRAGYGRLRIEDVAARSGVNKTTIYRRWPAKADLVCAALRTIGSRADGDPDTGSLRSDLIASFAAAMRGWGTRRGRGILQVLSAERADPVVDRLARGVRERALASRRRLVARAVDRRELPAGADVDLLLEVLTSAVQARGRRHGARYDPAWLARLVDFALAAAGARPTASRPSRGRLSRTDLAP
jgi:AcrR family transcriptional regulator